MNATILLSLLAGMNQKRKLTAQRFHSFRFEMKTTILLSRIMRMNEERSYKISPFWFREECDYFSIITKANECRTKLQAIKFHSFRFEMNATILLSLLTRMNEERSHKWQWFNSFCLEMNATILLSLIRRMNEERSYKIKWVHPFRFEMNAIFLLSLLNRMKKKEVTRFNVSPFSFRTNATILLSLLKRMNEERSCKIQGVGVFVSRWTWLSFHHY
jgi:hypothetical protein